MTQEEHWQQQYDQIMSYMKVNHRRPSKYHEEDLKMHNWIKYNKKVMNKGLMPAQRLNKFQKLLAKAEQYRRLNQYS